MATVERPETGLNGPGQPGELPARQESVALLLAAGVTLAEAARRNKVGATTIKRWNRDPAFKRRVQDIRGELVGRAAGKLADGMASAADTLGYLSRKATQETVRLGAARAMIDLGAKLRETTELEERIAALEARKP